MYSPVSTFPQALHLKHPRCHCFSSASSACPFLMSLPQPAQSGKQQQPAVTPYSFCRRQARGPASSEPLCAPISHSVDVYVSAIPLRFLSLHGEGGPHGPQPHTAATFCTAVDPVGMEVLCLFISSEVISTPCALQLARRGFNYSVLAVTFGELSQAFTG